MKREKQKNSILTSIMGYATHKNQSVDSYFEQSKDIKTHSEISNLKKRQAVKIDEDSLSKNWISNE